MDRAHNSSSSSLQKTPLSSREKLASSRRQQHSSVRKPHSSVRSSRNQLGRSGRGQTSNTGINNEGKTVNAINRIVVEGVDVTPRSLLFPQEDEAILASLNKDQQQQQQQNSSRAQSTMRSRRSSRSSNMSASERKRGSPQPPPSTPKQNSEDIFASKKHMPIVADVIDTIASAKTAKADETTDESPEQKSETKKVKLTTKELNEVIELTLSETKTETLIHIVGICVGTDSVEYKSVTEQNQIYDTLKENRSSQMDLFQDRHAQTFSLDSKNKEIMVKPVQTSETGCQAASWDIYDSNVKREQYLSGALSTNGLDDSGADILGGDEDFKVNAKAGTGETSSSAEVGVSVSLENRIGEMVALSLASPGCLLSLDSKVDASAAKPNKGKKVERESAEKKAEDQQETPEETEPNGDQVIAEREAEAIMMSTELLESLRTVERSIQQNIYHSKHLQYRAVNMFMETETEVIPEEQMAPAETEVEEGESEITNAMDTTETGEEVPSEEAVEQPSNVDEGGTVENGISAENETNSKIEGDQPDIADEGVDSESVTPNEAHVQMNQPKLERLWQFKCPETQGRNVASMAWNYANPDLLAVAYGQFEFSKQKDGAILFWTLKNPEYPERTIYTSSGVCSIDFSRAHPSMLAVGMYDGNIAIYDLRSLASLDGKQSESTTLGIDDSGAQQSKQLQPILQSSKLDSSEQHTDAVWQVRWVNRKDGIQGRSQEVLVSISMDGRITEWSLKKGLASTDLMVLKRVNSPFKRGLSVGEGIISRTAAGLCFDFPSDDSSIYYAGTEDGTIHKCSCSYNEQYLESYFGHAGPINRVECSPYSPNVFLSCSADWTMRLWDSQKNEPILTFQAVDLSDVVHDVCWSPSSSTVFGSVTGDGRVEIWDLEQSTLDPVITKFIEEPTAPEDIEEKEPQQNDDDTISLGKTMSDWKSERRSTHTTTTQKDSEGSKEHYSSIAFARNAPVVVVGDSNGTIDVFRLSGQGFKVVDEDELNTNQTIEQEISRLSEAIYPDRFVMSNE